MQIKIVNAATGEEVIREATPEEEASILTPPVPLDPRIVADLDEQAAAKADGQILTFLNWTPAELETWLVNNIDNAADLAALKASLHTALSVLGRIAIHGARGRKLR